MQIRSFRGSGEPVWVSARLSASFRLGPDPRRALGPAATPAASTGRTRDRTRPMLQKRQKALARAPSTRDPMQTCDGMMLLFGGSHKGRVYSRYFGRAWSYSAEYDAVRSSAPSAAPACMVAAMTSYTLAQAYRISGVNASPKLCFSAHINASAGDPC